MKFDFFWKVEEQHKKALEEDPSAFDYDGVYDEMKQKVARPIANDKQERKVISFKNVFSLYELVFLFFLLICFWFWFWFWFLF